jgi:beta-galactosidase
VDAVETTFGIRSVTMSDEGFLLNGKPLKMRGGCCHHDNGPLGAVSLYRSEERRVQTLKALGFNAIRTSHNPPSPALLDACDRLGMLVYDEFSDMWQHEKNPQDYHLHFPDWWKRDVTNWIMRDRNRACVVIWSIGNEISVWDAAMHTDATGASTEAYCRQLAPFVRSLDRTRPVTEGGDALGAGRPQSLDAGDIHYTTGRSSVGATLLTPVAGAPVNLADVHSAYPGKAVVCSESYPPAMYEAWQQVLDNEWMVGDFTWTAWDYIGEAAIGAPPLSPGTANGSASAYGLAGVGGLIPYPWYESYCGDVDLIGQRKPQSRYRSVVWGLSMVEMAVERPPPPGTQQAAIEAGDLTWGFYDELQSWTWDVAPGQPMTVHVYTRGDQVQLSLNGTVIATNSLTASDMRYTTFTVPYLAGTLTAVAFQGGREIGRKSFETVGSANRLRLTADAHRLTTGRDQLAYVLVEVLDDKDRLVPDAVVPVSFSLSGAGELAGVANANPHNVDSFKRPHRYTYHGQALAVLRPAKTPGSVTLTAQSAELQPARLTLPVAPAPAY